jgi:hypothetical protein
LETAVAVPPGVVTVTGTAEATLGCVMALTVVGLVTVKLAAGFVPNFTAVVPKRPAPLIVTVVVPLVVPVVGVNVVTVGMGATYV